MLCEDAFRRNERSIVQKNRLPALSADSVCSRKKLVERVRNVESKYQTVAIILLFILLRIIFFYKACVSSKSYYFIMNSS